jgi:S-adenosylmethionine decarboxylase
MTAVTDNYGYQLTMLINNIERHESLNDVGTICKFLEQLVRDIGFRVIAGPLSTSGPFPSEHAGVSAVVILYESHAAIHTYMNVRSAFIDVFGCREFCLDKVESVIHLFFGEHRIAEVHYAPRGSNWSQNAAVELDKWQTTR